MYQNEELETLTDAMLESLYVLLSLARIENFTPTEIKYGGKALQVPSNIPLMLKIASQITEFIEKLYRVLASPSRLLMEEISIGEEIKGALYIPLTVQLRGRGQQLIAYKRRRLTLNSPENLLLKLFLKRLIRDAETVLNSLNNLKTQKQCPQTEILEKYIARLEKQIKTMRNKLEAIERLPLVREISTKNLEPTDRNLLKLSRIVLRRRIKEYRSLAHTVNRYVKEKFNVKLLRKDYELAEHLAATIQPYKLYEVYTYYVTAVALVETLRPPILLNARQNIIEVKPQGRTRYKLLYDKPISEKSWLHMGKARFNGVKERTVPPGRPDISLLIENEPALVLDAKYSESLEYISQARYKILGYLNEYNLQTGGLIYDPDRLNGEPADEEDIEFSSLLKEVNKHEGAVLEDSDKRIYLLPLKTASWTEIKRTRTYTLIKNMLTETSS